MGKNKIVVAYSGGLDTSVMVKWLKDNYDAEIITFTGNLGQTKEPFHSQSRVVCRPQSSRPGVFTRMTGVDFYWSVSMFLL